MTTRKIYNENVGVLDDAAGFDTIRALFLSRTSGEAVTLSKSFHAQASNLDLVDALTPHITDPDVSSTRKHNVFISGTIDGRDVLVCLWTTEESHETDEIGYGRGGIPIEQAPVRRSALDIGMRSFTIEVTGHRKDGLSLFAVLDARFSNAKVAQIKWWHSEHGRTTYKTLFLPPLKTELFPEFYPDMGDPSAYLNRFIQSEAAILLVAGPPGTGKTTLLRHLICDFKLGAHIVYDETLMQSDQVFQCFLFEKESDILIIEDADTILSAREVEKNRLMARFLNVSDGLIKLPDKKLVFTTNISDFGKIDEALVRPGRCFDLLCTRKLNLTEAQAAARAADLPIPTAKGEYTLAELFNQGQRPVKLRRAGF